ncbi:ComEC/Rec2 family competence protein [Falsiphaeobacter marinintestinus]|uniref:ComEC/Rec2 family competence protein n=1 Tax=Falsiphaeobacter marinintestinus TaxID=1492905 RepID=UPI0011B6E0EB|nr:ComEC/Rec2 family competence protein [Phaeobacter marinintestinus]
MGILAGIDAVLLQQRGHLFPWSPVFLGLGIGLYFMLRAEPDWPVYAVSSGLGAAFALVALRWPGGWSALGWAAALLALGFGLAGARAHTIAGPVLKWRYYGPVEGRIVGVDRSASDALRLTLDQVRLRNVAPGDLPKRVRVSLHGPLPERVQTGQRIMTTAHMSPPQGPAEPGGFDFRRHAWFQSLGGVGYTRVPVLTAAPPAYESASVRVTALRMTISRRVQSVLSGDTGGFAAAVTTGDRSGVSQAALQALRDSNLAHLLAISGLHMGLLAGFVFTALRVSLSLIPPLALRIPVRKIAAALALLVSAGYLVLSGGNVSTERAFVMTAVMLGAVLVDRRAISLRAVAVAAMIVMILRPESLLSPGFQMSFAATTALVAVFGWMRDFGGLPKQRWKGAVVGVVVSSAVAGLATAPVGAGHFNTMSHYGLIANLLCVPLMGVLVIPSAVLALCLAPFGAEALGLELMGVGLRWTLAVAHWVADLPGAVGHVKSPAPIVLPLIYAGALWLILWQGRWRLTGTIPIVAAFALWGQSDRPVVLIADTGALVGVLTDHGRALSKPKGAGFVAGVWLENDGDARDQVGAAARWPQDDGKIRAIEVAGAQVTHIIGKRAVADFDSCKAGEVIVLTADTQVTGPCIILDPQRLRKTGAVAIDGRGMITAKSIGGDRIWTQ